MANLVVFDEARALVDANEDFWSRIGAHTPKHSAEGVALGTFLRDVWNPFYTAWLKLTARSLSDHDQAQVARNVGTQLRQIRDDAGYRYHVPASYDGDIDGRLDQLAEDAGFVIATMPGAQAYAVQARVPGRV